MLGSARLTSGQQGRKRGATQDRIRKTWKMNGSLESKGYGTVVRFSALRARSLEIRRRKKSDQILFQDDKPGYCGRVAPERSPVRGANRGGFPPSGACPPATGCSRSTRAASA